MVLILAVLILCQLVQKIESKRVMNKYLRPPLWVRTRSHSDSGLYEKIPQCVVTFATESDDNLDVLRKKRGVFEDQRVEEDTSTEDNDDTAHNSSNSELARVRSAVTSYSSSSLHCHGPICGSDQYLHIPNAKDMKSKVKNAKLKSQRSLSISTPVMTPCRASTPDLEEKFIPHRNLSRNKKFHRIFKQMPVEEKVVNYFACALLAEILLQGHLYITENYFGFYSNVFGHVTKILIPVNKVLKITKEKTARIIPNAVGVETEDNKHVFGSLLSRETTFQLMFKVWAKYANTDVACIRDDSETENHSPDIEPDIIEDEEDDDSDDQAPSGTSTESCDSVADRSYPPSPSNISMDTASNKTKDSVGTPLKEELRLLKDLSAPVVRSCFQKVYEIVPVDRVPGSARDFASKLYKLPRSTFLLLIATVILVFLFLSAAVLINRLNSLHYKISSYSSWNGDEKADLKSHIFQEVFKWQHELHDNCINDVQDTLTLRIQQLIEVRRSLQTLLLLLLPENLPRSSKKSPSSEDKISNTVV